MTRKNHRFTLAARPVGLVKATDFAFEEEAVRELGDGEREPRQADARAPGLIHRRGSASRRATRRRAVACVLRYVSSCYATSVAFEADVIVLSHDVPEVRLVAEVKRTIANLPEAEAQMRRYMLARRCSLALLVTPERTRIYRDTYADYTDATVQFVGEFSTADLLDLERVPTDEHALQDAVREWLDRLAISWPSALPKNAAAREPVLRYLVPEVTDGRVSSGSLG
jgi:hypothetical protein